MTASLSFLSWTWIVLGSLGTFLLSWGLLDAVPFEAAVRPSREGFPGRMFRAFSGILATWRERSSARRLAETVRELLPQALETAVQSLRAGQTVSQAFELLSRESAPPLRGEFARVCREMAMGSPVEKALETFVRRVPTPETRRLLESYRLSRWTGADLTQLLQTLRDGMEERDRLSRRLESMTAQARLSGLLMGVLPLFLAVVLTVMDPGFMAPLFTTSTGWVFLGAAAFLETVGFLWIRNLMKREI